MVWTPSIGTLPLESAPFNSLDGLAKRTKDFSVARCTAVISFVANRVKRAYLVGKAGSCSTIQSSRGDRQVEMSVMLVRDGNGQTAVELLRRRGSAEAPRRLPPQTQVQEPCRRN